MALYSGVIGATGTTKHGGAGPTLVVMFGIPVIVTVLIVLAIVTR